MESHRVVSRNQWIEERKALLAREKEFTQLRDQLSHARRFNPGDDFCALWHIFDLLPGGAGDWQAKYRYG